MYRLDFQGKFRMWGPGFPSALVRPRTKAGPCGRGLGLGRGDMHRGRGQERTGDTVMEPNGGADERGFQDPQGIPSIWYGLTLVIVSGDMAWGLIPTLAATPPWQLCLSWTLALPAWGTV